MGFLEDEIRRIEGMRWRRAVRIAAIVVVILFAIVVAGWFLTYTKEGSIAVIYLEGTLSTGDFSTADATGSEFVGGELRDAADNPLVEAIVLRVNSPGGTPAAAQEIAADMEYAKARKPVVISMGDIATSAAYAVSAHGSRIYANPDTLTGGVGTIWIFTDISEWLKNEGYNVTVVKSGARKDMSSPYRPLTDEERLYAQDLVNASFERFMDDIVAQRNISRTDIEDGRVIRGEEAVKIGLVDRLGNLHDAIEGARSLAGSAV
ncbi:MAG: signal peptide peptidase SppA [Methanomicrobiales archaeon]|nr:signal peptide peptidase SppA [Methanomicrobiales archaeon]MDD1668295.1 signal peptide peptidase SppA [Methanomicrobiales archaeon]